MKSPAEQYTDDVCKRKVAEFIAANGQPDQVTTKPVFEEVAAR